MYPVKIYNKFMKLLKVVKSTELSEIFWRDKRRKKDANLTPNELKNLGVQLQSNINKEYKIICSMCGKKAVMRSARARYCSIICRKKSKKRRDDENKAKRNNTRRKGKKGIR
jgi:hypothetical protein